MKISNLFSLPAFLSWSFAIGVLFSCHPSSITIEGSVKNTKGKQLFYFHTIDGIYTTMSKDTLRLKSDSSFTITLASPSPEKVDFYLSGQRRSGSIYVLPGVTEIEIDGSSSRIEIKNGLVHENETMENLKALEEEVFKLRTGRKNELGIIGDTVASSVYDKLVAYARKLENNLTGLDPVFKNKVVQDIRMQLLLAFESQYLETTSNCSEPTRKAWNDVFSKMSDYADLNNPDNAWSSAFPQAIVNYQGIQYINHQQGSLPPVNEKQRFLFDLYEKSLKGRVQEVAMANIIFEDDLEEVYSACIPELCEKFRSLHPQSVLSPYIEKIAIKNQAFQEATVSEDIHFLPSDSIFSFKEITNRFSGKVVFIDIWATWCAPCRANFAYTKPLQQYAKEKDIVLLYITINQPEEKDFWKKMIGYYDLKGEHLLPNETFVSEIHSLFGRKGGLAIPHYAIIDKKGELRFPTAESPANMDRLIPQLEAAAK